MGILQFALVALGLFYLVIAIYSIIRLIKVFTTKSAIKISISFYTGMLVASLARAISLYLISINIITPNKADLSGNKAQNIFIYLMLIIPDMTNICVYLFLIWYFYANFILSHINLANDLSLFTKNDEPTISGKTYTLLYVMIPVYFVVFVIVCALTFTSQINNEALYIINSYFALITPILFMAYYIFLLIKFSGRPYYNENLKWQVRKILLIVFIWSITRMITGIFGLAISGSFIDSIINDFDEKSNSMLYSISILVYFIISEYIPDFFALDYSLMMTYIKDKQNLINADEENQDFNEACPIVTNSENSCPSYSRKVSLNNKNNKNSMENNILIQNNTSSNNNNNNNDYRNSNFSSNINKKYLNDFMIKFTEIQLLEQIFQRKNGLGNIFKSVYQSKDVTCRVIKFERLSRYDLEGLSKDMEELIPLNHPNICPITGICVESLPNIYILWPYYKTGSLYDLIHVQKNQMDLKKRIQIAKDIARGMDYLHDHMIYHYHLSSRNIYLNEDYTPLIADYGFHYLKDISSVFFKYKNKNSYSSPELLIEKTNIGNVTSNTDNHRKSDIYSFGILLWELYTCTIPFNISLQNLYNYVVVSGYRPEITNDFNPEIAALIRECWDVDPSKRPTFKQSIEILNNSELLMK